MREILSAAQTARVIGCAPQMVRERIKRGIWTFGSVVTAKQSGNVQCSYEVKKRDLADWLGISVEEVERRMDKRENELEKMPD